MPLELIYERDLQELVFVDGEPCYLTEAEIRKRMAEGREVTFQRKAA